MATTADTVTIQDLATQIGRESVSDWVEVSQDMINNSPMPRATTSSSRNEEMAKMTPFGGTIAHGFLTLSLMPLSRRRPIAADRGRENGRQLWRQ